KLSKATLDNLIYKTKVNKIKSFKYSNFLYTTKKTLLKFTLKYLLKIANKYNILKLYSFKINIKIVKVINNNPNTYKYLISFFKIAKVTKGVSKLGKVNLIIRV
ncbi:hypothetical protein GQ607_016904, partial [Colletotrichum asianum]